LITLDSVRRCFGAGSTQVTALDRVSLGIHSGERIAVVGRSGSGKTTLLSLLGLIEAPDSGAVSYDGRDCSDLTEAERTDLRRRHIGLVFQLFHLVPALDVLDNVLLPTLPDRGYRTRTPRARELIERIGLGDRVSHRPGQLSGGEQQRVAIARALINDPDLLLADEPTGNLDSQTSRDVIELLLDLQSELGFAMVLATHDLELAERMTRRIVLADGHISQG
jgi:ABC-type lipoprotein export system ATPase subunit